MKDKAAVISRIQMLMEFWGIQPEELEGGEAVAPKAIPPQPTAPSGPKYMHPKTGEMWDGQGVQPQWLKDAVLKEGYLPEELRRAAAEWAQRQEQQHESSHSAPTESA